MFNPTNFENSLSGGAAVLQVVDAAAAEDERAQRFVPLKTTTLSGEIVGPLAALQVQHTFGYTRETCASVLEACYRFPLPGDAAVTGVSVRYGDVEIVTELKERDQAEADYADAKAQGKQASLLSREAPDVFTLQVAGIRPDEDVVVTTSYVQLARADGLKWTLRVPLTTAPRYVRADELGSAHARGQPLAVLRDPGHRFKLDIIFREISDIVSPTHDLIVEAADDGCRAQLAGGSIVPDRDCLLAWRPLQRPTQSAMTVYCHDDIEDGTVYFLAQIAPPDLPDENDPVAREVMLLVDNSGSMTGAKSAAANWAVERFLAGLHPDDLFGLALFQTTTEWFRRRLSPADDKSTRQAVEWLGEYHDSGGTNLGTALEETLRFPLAEGDRARNVLVITDAQVTDEGRILRLADDEAARAVGRRISVLCIDAAPNGFLAQQLAERGGGIAKFLTSSPREADITTALDGLLATWGRPVLANLQLAVNRAYAQPSGNRLVGGADGAPAIDLGDLPAGQALWTAGRAPRGDGGPLVLKVQGPDGQIIATAQVDLGEPNNCPQLKALFGARRVNALEFLVHAGYAPDQLAEQMVRLGYDAGDALALSGGQIYAENTRKETEQALHTLLVKEALTYGLPSSVTSFVAVRSEAGQRVEGTVVVANALPAGWSDAFVLGRAARPGMRQTMRSALRGVLPGGVLPGGALPSGILPDMASGVMPFASGMPAPASGPGMAMPAQSPMVGGGRPTTWTTLYDGDLRMAGATAVLYDSDESALQPPSPTTIGAIRLQHDEGLDVWRQLDRSVELLIYVDDLAAPRARVSLVDLIQLGERPLNLLRQKGQRFQIVLRDPNGYLVNKQVTIAMAVRW